MLTTGTKVKVIIYLAAFRNVSGLAGYATNSIYRTKWCTATENPKQLSSLLQIHHNSKFQRLPTSSALHSDNRRSIYGFRFSRSKTKTYGECNNFKSRFSLKAGSNALSLDRAMLPRSASVLFKLIGYLAGLNGIFSYLVGAIIASTIVKLLLALFRGSSEEDDVERPSSLGGIIWSKVVNALKSIRSSETSSVEEAALDLSKWNVCKLQERSSLGTDYSLFTLELPDSSASSSPLALGQELTLCVVDSRDRVLKEGCFPVSWSAGQFQIAVRNPPSVSNRTGSSREKFSAALLQLQAGDELAVKAGRRRLSYRGPEKDIENVAMVVSGGGIAPALQILQQVLRSAGTAEEGEDDDAPALGTAAEAETAFELLWINERKGDFLLNEAVENLEARFPEQFFVARVIDPNFADPDSQVSEKLQEAISPQGRGKVALLLVPDQYATKAKTFLESIGYGEDSVSAITIED